MGVQRFTAFSLEYGLVGLDVGLNNLLYIN